MRRAHSVYEMRKALERRAEDASLVRPVLDRLKRDNLLDDARYARQFARTRAQAIGTVETGPARGAVASEA